MKINNETDPLHISYSTRNISIPTRFFFAPINTGFSNNGEPQDDFIEFYKVRSGNFIGINYIGNVAISSEYVTNANTAFFTDNDEKWLELVQIIHNAGSVAGIQIACRNSSLVPIRKMINNDITTYKQHVQNDILNLTEAEISKIIAQFIDSSIHAYRLGFKVIQIHAAHGYFLSQLLSNELNTRNDKFAPLNNFVISSIVEGIRANTMDVIIDVRISLLEGLTNPEAELKYKAELIGKLTQLDIDMISFSNGIYDVNKQLIYPLEQWGHAFFLKNIIKYAEKYPNILWNTAGNIWNIDELKLDTLPNNLTFSIGRSLIADPLFIKKSFEKQNSKINRCEFKNKCHYYSLNLEHVGCPIYELNKTIT